MLNILRVVLTDIEFTMPLLEEEGNSNEFSGKLSVDVNAKIVDDEEPERWLETMGAEQSEIKRLQSSQVIFKKCSNSFKLFNLLMYTFRVNWFQAVNEKLIVLKSH